MAKKEQFGEMLIEALEEAVAFEQGELPDVRVERVALDGHVAELSSPPRYTLEEIPRRVHELRTGAVQPIPGEEVFAALKDLFR